GKDRVGRVWSVENGKSTELKLAGFDIRHAVAWSPDGKHIATGATNGPLGQFFALWDAGGKFRKRAWHTGKRLMTTRALAFTPDSRRIVETPHDGYSAGTPLHDVPRGDIVREVLNENPHRSEVPSGPTAVSASGRWIAVADDRHHRIYLEGPPRE